MAGDDRTVAVAFSLTAYDAEPKHPTSPFTSARFRAQSRGSAQLGRPSQAMNLDDGGFEDDSTDVSVVTLAGEALAPD